MYFKKLDKYSFKSELNYHLCICYVADNRPRYCVFDNHKINIGVCKTFEGAVKLARTHHMLNQ